MRTAILKTYSTDLLISRLSFWMKVRLTLSNHGLKYSTLDLRLAGWTLQKPLQLIIDNSPKALHFLGSHLGSLSNSSLSHPKWLVQIINEYSVLSGRSLPCSQVYTFVVTFSKLHINKQRWVLSLSKDFFLFLKPHWPSQYSVSNNLKMNASLKFCLGVRSTKILI